MENTAFEGRGEELQDAGCRSNEKQIYIAHDRQSDCVTSIA